MNQDTHPASEPEENDESQPQSESPEQAQPQATEDSGAETPPSPPLAEQPVAAAPAPAEFLRFVRYRGDFGELLKVYLVNLLLSIVTLGLYYPWARAALLKYHCGETEVFGSRLAFLGTGRQMFLGYLKSLFVLFLAAGLILALVFYAGPEFAAFTILFVYAALLIFMPVLIYGFIRFRLTHTTWRGIRFGFRDQLGPFYKFVILELLLVLVTVGIYSSWAYVNILQRMADYARLGSLKFRFRADATKLFLIYLKYFALFFVVAIFVGIFIAVSVKTYEATGVENEIFLSVAIIFAVAFLVLFVTPLFQRELLTFFLNGFQVVQDEQVYPIRASYSVGDSYLVMLVYPILGAITGGILIPLIRIEYFRFLTKGLSIRAGLELEIIEQTEEAAGDGTSDAMALFLFDI